jgi:hypothetical protein
MMRVKSAFGFVLFLGAGLLLTEARGRPTQAQGAPTLEDCCNLLDDDQDGKTDFGDEDCAAAPDCVPLFVRGDATADFKVDISDAIFILSFLFNGGAGSSCLDALDSSDDGRIDLGDAVGILTYLFLSGPPPSPPFPACGEDPTGGDGFRCRAWTCVSR